MNDKQIAIVLQQLHDEKLNNKGQSLSGMLDRFNLDPEEKDNMVNLIKTKYENGIKNLNKNQLSNISTKIFSDGFNEEYIKSRLKFYEVEKQYFQEIVSFYKNYSDINITIDVSDLDQDFKGVQVASRDDFNKIINQGYTGDWVLTPSSVKHNYVQVASMNETGLFPRGNYLNAEIDRIEPIEYGDQVRYRIFIKNPIVVDSGNRNVKFNLNPVRYVD
ncbi:hypothetical protein [Salinimicrobium terrae]|uniref:hypothetical protein n=1 Tax=Salinimicrobium terrae TaxID=470866 RepID=UPI000404AF4D|nr:hypothetical protein [Salinimicrobium terrae]